MTYDEQLTAQRERARMLIEFGRAKRLTLVRVSYPDMEDRVSIIGGAISWGAVEVWKMQGATVEIIEELVA